MIHPLLLVKHTPCLEGGRSLCFQFCDTALEAGTLWRAGHIQCHVFCDIVLEASNLCWVGHNENPLQGGDTHGEVGASDVPRAHCIWRMEVSWRSWVQCTPTLVDAWAFWVCGTFCLVASWAFWEAGSPCQARSCLQTLGKSDTPDLVAGSRRMASDTLPVLLA